MTDTWDDFVRRAKECVDSGQLESGEVGYKVEISSKLKGAREAVLSGAEDWAGLVKRGIAGNIIHNVQQSRFRNWIDEHPEDALQALRAIWTKNSLSVSERIIAFTDQFPPSVTRIRGAGTRMNIVSALLMGLNVEQYPPFRVTMFDWAYERTGYDKRRGDADEAGLYNHALSFLDRFVEEAAERGLELRHRLDAQSVAWMMFPRGDREIQDRDDDQRETEEPTRIV